MFTDGAVSILKMNPINDYLGPVMEEIFADLVEAGFLRFTYGGADVGQQLTTHAETDSVHITGGLHTYNSIVFGSGREGEQNRKNDTPVMTKPVFAELGGVTPVIVAQGKWSSRDIRFQAEHIVSQKMHNAGFNCIGAQILVVPNTWDQADDLVDAIRQVLNETPGRQPYYPDSAERCERLTTASENSETLGGAYPRYLISDVDPTDTASPWFTKEIWGPVLAVTRLPGDDVASFLSNAVEFVNSTVAGTLGVNIVIDPATARAHHEALDQALADLDYGTVAVNAWSGVAYFMSKCAWGAFPGHTRDDIGSGVGFVHNALMFDKPQKSIVTGPFAPAPRTFVKGDFHLGPKMVYFVTNTQAHVIGEKLIDYCDRPTKAKLASIAFSASRG
jgi:aldehyde dehydrogenase (NAD(P)+)